MTTTDKVWVGLIGAALAYEGYALANSRRGDTLSEAVWNHVARRPLVPFTLGALVSHFVWQAQDVYDTRLKRELTNLTEDVKDAAADLHDKSAAATT